MTEVLPHSCGMSKDMRMRLVDAGQINRDLPALSEGKLLDIRGVLLLLCGGPLSTPISSQREMVRLRLYHHSTGSDVDHLTLPPARGPPVEDGEVCRYWRYQHALGKLL